jgi:dephospho-CoA kinase
LRPFTVGLTGGIGAGKSTIASFFAKHGVLIIDADLVTHEIWEQDRDFFLMMQNHFGNSIISSEGLIDRFRIREIVFSVPSELDFIEGILLPKIRNQLQSSINSATSQYVVAVVPLLFEKNFDDLVDRTLCVDLDTDIQIERASVRDNCSIEKIKKIVSKQMSRSERRARSDDIIYNCESVYEKTRTVDYFHEFYLRRAEKL